MIKLDAGNVMLKPSHRRRLMASLKRSLKLGQRLGDFVLTITMHRVGRMFELVARVHDAAGDFACRVRQQTWDGALRELTHVLSVRLHDQCLRRAVA